LLEHAARPVPEIILALIIPEKGRPFGCFANVPYYKIQRYLNLLEITGFRLEFIRRRRAGMTKTPFTRLLQEAQ